jgi:hypothetical protein
MGGMLRVSLGRAVNARSARVQSLWMRSTRYHKDLAVILLNTIILIVAVELALRGGIPIYKSLKDRYAPWQDPQLLGDVARQGMVRPRGTAAENRRIAEESLQNTMVVYQPWVEFRMMDIQGEYLNHVGITRRSLPQVTRELHQDEAYYDIFFLGGSTMYGANLADSETIPSCFVRAYAARFPESRPVRVFNYGQGFYYSYQELLFLVDQVLRGNVPGAVVFLDGLNDLIQPRSSYFRESFFAPRMRSLIDQQNRGQPIGGLLSQTIQHTSTYYALRRMGLIREEESREGRASYELPAGMSKERVFKALFRNYLDTTEAGRRFCASFGVNVHFFWQPVPFYRYTRRDLDPICDKRDMTQFSEVYPLVEEAFRGHADTVFLGNMLEHAVGFPFIDHFHYSPQLNQAIAEEMLRALGPDPWGPRRAAQPPSPEATN